MPAEAFLVGYSRAAVKVVLDDERRLLKKPQTGHGVSVDSAIHSNVASSMRKDITKERGSVIPSVRWC
jgi:hypothetical protein